MSRRLIFPLLLGIVGTAILLSLGVWQLQRLAWKEAILAKIDATIAASPVAVPSEPDPVRDAYLPVVAEGRFTGEHIDVLVSRKQQGAGVRAIEVFETDGRRLLVDRGFIPDDQRGAPRDEGAASVVGNLHWPEEVDDFTPPPDEKTGLWFARDVVAMSEKLKTEPVLIIAREATGQGIEPIPVDNSGIPNDHLGYAIQWFGLAIVWMGMTGYLLWRIRRRTM